MNKITTAAVCFSLTGCLHNMPAWKYDIFDRPPGNQIYPEKYIHGWQDGCETGASTSANELYSFRYKYKQDSSLIMDETYYAGWQTAFNHCRKYILQDNLRSIQRGRL